MNSLTCNHCKAKKAEGSGPEAAFHLTSCFHLFCAKCVPGPGAKCRVCAKPSQSVQIGPDMKSELKSFFENRAQTSGNVLQALDFQLNLMQNAVAPLKKKIERYKSQISEVASALSALKKKCFDGASRNKELEEAHSALAEDVERMRKEVALLKESATLNASIRMPAINKGRDPRPLMAELEQFQDDTMNLDLDTTTAPCPNTTVNVFTSKKSQYFQGPHVKRNFFK